jgi:hypothetical protein
LVLLSCFAKISLVVAHSSARASSVPWGVVSSTAHATSGRFIIAAKSNSVIVVRGGSSNAADDDDADDDVVAATAEEEEVVKVPVQADVPIEDSDEEEKEEEELVDGGDTNAERVDDVDEGATQLDEEENEGDDLQGLNEEENEEDDLQGFGDEPDTVSGEPEKTWETPDTSFSRETPTMDDGDTSAFVDRMELADAYDEGETTPGSFEVESAASDASSTQTAVAADTEAPSAPVNAALGKVPTEIDQATKKVLILELKYRRAEVKNMRPDVAKIAVEKKLKRPIEGVPANWFVGGTPSRRGSLFKILPKVLVPVIVGAMAVATGTSFDFSTLGSSSAVPKSARLKPPPAAASSPGLTPVETVKEEEESSRQPLLASKETEPDVVPKEKHGNALDTVHAHSVKPGQRPAAKNLDVTLLDKGITAVENKVKAFFAWTI